MESAMPNELVRDLIQRFVLPAIIVPFTIVAWPREARADWPANGLAVCADTSAQSSPAIASDGAGGAFIAWLDQRSPDSGIYLQRVLAGGEIAPGWPANGVFLSPPTSALSPPFVAPDGTGGVFVAWAGNYDVLLQRVTGSGEVAASWPIGGLVLASTFPWLELAFVIADGAGGAIVAWTHTTSSNIRVLRVAGDGTVAPGWSFAGVPVSASGFSVFLAALASDGAGGAIVTWWADSDIYAQRIDGGGARAPGWPADGLVVCGATGVQRNVRILQDGAGGAFISWRDERTLATTGADLYLQRVTGAGATAAGWPADGLPICTATGEQALAEIAPDGAGGVVAFWRDLRVDAEGDVYAQRVTGDGGIATGWPADGLAVSAASGQQAPGFASLVPDGAGGTLFMWSDTRDLAKTGRDIYVQHLGADGIRAPGWPDGGLALCVAAGDQNLTRAVGNGSGGAIVTWQDGREDASRTDIYAALINGDGSTPVQLSLVSAEAGPDVVRLHWYVADAPGLRATLQRRTAATDWATLREVAADGAGHIDVEDRDVVPGERYGYRLGIADESGVALAGDVWVDVPLAAALSVRASWDPRAGAVRVEYSLPVAGPAAFDIFDAGGRRRAAERIDGDRLGGRVLTLRLGDGPSPGILFIRLRQGEASARARVVIIY
jgi:hypothetical protein